MSPLKVKRTRNGGTWTESRYWSAVRSTLRRGFKYWKPAVDAKIAARRKYEGENKRQKWEYQCAQCKDWFMEKEIQIDHINPVGTLRSEKDLIQFLRNLTPENGFQVLCKKHHKEKTLKEKENANN